MQQPQRALEAFERYLSLVTTPDEKVSGWVKELKVRLGNTQRSAESRVMKFGGLRSTGLRCAAANAFGAEPAAPSQEQPKPAAAKPAASSAAQANPAVKTSAAPRADRLELDTTVVTGNRELPKVLYIVPWKKADIGDLPAQPFNTLLDEVLTPVDRDVFRREVTYYEAVSAGGKDATAAPAPQLCWGPEK